MRAARYTNKRPRALPTFKLTDLVDGQADCDTAGFPSLPKWSAPPSCGSGIAIGGARARANYRRIRLRA